MKIKGTILASQLTIVGAVVSIKTVNGEPIQLELEIESDTIAVNPEEESLALQTPGYFS